MSRPRLLLLYKNNKLNKGEPYKTLYLLSNPVSITVEVTTANVTVEVTAEVTAEVTRYLRCL
jgi:hypothetical protein